MLDFDLGNNESYIDLEEGDGFTMNDKNTAPNFAMPEENTTTPNTTATTATGAPSVYKKVSFVAKDNIDAQEIVNTILSYGVDPNSVTYETSISGEIKVAVYGIDVSIFNKINRVLSVRRGAQTVSGVVGKAANTAVNVAGTAINTIGVPVARTAVKTGFGVLKTALGAATKIGAMVISETVKGGREAAANFKNDAYVAEAKQMMGATTGGNKNVIIEEQ